MRRTSRPVPILLLGLAALFASGCGGEAASLDAGHDGSDAALGPDAGARDDAGGLDGGAERLDADTRTDAGPSLDASTPPDGGPAVDADGIDAGDLCAFAAEADRACSVDGDCAAAQHQTDCCGNARWLGMRVNAAERFRTLEPACAESYPRCGCPARPPTTDSGETVADPADVRVGCIAHAAGSTCESYVSMRPLDEL